MTSSARGMLALLAALTLGVALAIRTLQGLQIGLVVAAVLIAFVAATGSRPIGFLRDEGLGRILPLFVGGVAISIFFVQVVRFYPTANGLQSSVRLVGCVAVVVLALLTLMGRGGPWVAGGLVAAYAATMAAMIGFTTGGPTATDVVVFQQDGVDALLRGENPFALVFPDIYPPESSAAFYAPGLSVDGVLQFGYPYFPLGLLVITPFEWLGDFRFAHLTAVIACAALMLWMSSHVLSRMATVVLLLASPSVLIVRLGWMDPLVLVAVVLVVAVAVRSARRKTDRTSAATGLIFAMKQYTAFLLIPTLLLLERPWTTRAVVRHFAIAGSVFLLITLPFALWDIGAFWWSAVELQFVQPYRPDSIALPALVPDLWSTLSPIVTVGGPVIIVVVVSVIVAFKTPTGGQGFALGAGLVLAVAFVTSKQAFANYYFVVLGTLCAAASATQANRTADTSEHSMSRGPHTVPETGTAGRPGER